MNVEKIVNWPGRMTQGIEHGTVRGGGDEGYMVHCPSGLFVATTAFSCLVRPLEGDKVMVARDDEGGCYILAILERTTSPNAVLSFPGDVKVESAQGNVTIAASAGIDLTSGASLNLGASEVNLAAAKSRFNVVDVQTTVASFTGTLNQVRLISDAVDVVAARLTQRLRSYFRSVEEVEQVMAGQMIQKVENLFSVQARQSVISAKDDVKVDGERVHIG